jgi:chemotaxis protein CheD
MIIPLDSIPKIYLKPGELHFAVTPTIVSTVLGSCVSITMHNRQYQLGVICHAVLPEELAPGEPYRYVDSSVAAMLRMFARYGIAKSDIEVKIFGGAETLPLYEKSSHTVTVGKQNILRAHQIIEKEHLKLLASDVGGTRGRKLLFYTQTGEIYLQRLRGTTR